MVVNDKMMPVTQPDDMGKQYIVSRHPATVRWLERALTHTDGVFAELPLSLLQPGDRVYGNLTAHLIAAVCARGCSYYHVMLHLPLELRGKELNDELLQDIRPEIVRIEATIMANDTGIPSH
jgi:putative CRISPR-associated protein (TIGR02620 family)